MRGAPENNVLLEFVALKAIHESYHISCLMIINLDGPQSLLRSRSRIALEVLLSGTGITDSSS